MAEYKNTGDLLNLEFGDVVDWLQDNPDLEMVNVENKAEEELKAKLSCISEFGEELKNASNPFLHPHIDGVVAVTILRVKRGESINSTTDKGH